MTAVAIHFAGGDAFFSGAGLLLFAVLLRSASWFSDRMSERLALFFAVADAAFIAASATPLHWSAYVSLSVAAGVWLAWNPKTKRKLRLRNVPLVVAVAACIAMELPFRFSPRLPTARHETLYVIGDSIVLARPRGDLVTS